MACGGGRLCPAHGFGPAIALRSGHLFAHRARTMDSEHHAVPTTDPFSATLRGAHWVAFEWLSQVAFAMVHAAGGWIGVVALTAAAVGVALGLLTWLVVGVWRRNGELCGVFSELFVGSAL